MGLCLVGHHPVLSTGKNPQRLGLIRPLALLCPRSPGLDPRSRHSYLIMDSLVTQLGTQLEQRHRCTKYFSDLDFAAAILRRRWRKGAVNIRFAGAAIAAGLGVGARARLDCG